MEEGDFGHVPSLQRTKHSPLGFVSGFLYKSFVVAVLLFLLPLFPSQPPEIMNQTILTRGWELIHLLLVGITVSYGLFGRRNADPMADKDSLQKHEACRRSYVSEVLQVASVFDDDEVETASVEGSQAQMWSSGYYRAESRVVVQRENSGHGSETSKPLLLPVRSLKMKAVGPEPANAEQVLHARPGPGDLGLPEVVAAEAVEEEKSVVVLPSPIPWRSRPGRMDARAESGVPSAPQSDSTPPLFSTSVVRSRSFQSGRTRRASTSPSTSPSPDLRAKNVEGSVKGTNFHKPSTPPPPPPPPHFSLHKRRQGLGHNIQTKTSFKDLDRSGGGREPAPSPTTKATSSTGGRIPLHNSRPPVSPLLKTTHAEKKNGSPRKFIIDSSSDGDRAPTDVGEEEDGDDEEETSNSGAEREANANEVDKKADEFIAKFREQIRLQRIESIRRSTVQKRAMRKAQA